MWISCQSLWSIGMRGGLTWGAASDGNGPRRRRKARNCAEILPNVPCPLSAVDPALRSPDALSVGRPVEEPTNHREPTQHRAIIARKLQTVSYACSNRAYP